MQLKWPAVGQWTVAQNVFADWPTNEVEDTECEQIVAQCRAGHVLTASDTYLSHNIDGRDAERPSLRN